MVTWAWTDERLKPQLDRRLRAILDVADAYALYRLRDPKSVQGAQAREEVALRVMAAQEADAELARFIAAAR